MDVPLDLSRQVALHFAIACIAVASGCSPTPSVVCESLDEDDSWQRLESVPHDADELLRYVKESFTPQSYIWYRNKDGRLAMCAPGIDDSVCDDRVFYLDDNGRLFGEIVLCCG